MRSFVVTGSDGPLAQLVRQRLEALGPVRVAPSETTEVRAQGPAAGPAATAALFDGCDTWIDLGPSLPLPSAGVSHAGVSSTAVSSTAVAPAAVAPAAVASLVSADRAMLDGAQAARVGTVVHLSSAIVYGAWSDNPIPLTEEAPLRPNPGLRDAAGHAERERLIADWAADRSDIRVSVLRPAVVIGAGIDSAPARGLSGRVPLRPHHLDPPRQFVHVEDLAAAIAMAAGDRLDGVFNVAPDGWIGGEQARVLGSAGPTLAVPDRIVTAAASVAWKLRLSTMPPEVIPLLEQPWVVANDRLRGAGWAPSFTNEEALVAGTAGSRWREMSPARRQEVALAGSAAVLAGVAAGATAALRRRRLRRLRRS